MPAVAANRRAQLASKLEVVTLTSNADFSIGGCFCKLLRAYAKIGRVGVMKDQRRD